LSFFFRERSVYYSELNIKRSQSNSISNFFYKTRFWKKGAKVISSRRYKNIIFYYINKLALTNYPYLYWTYYFNYNRYQYNKDASFTSVHVRTHILFIFINEHHKFTFSERPSSFIKFNFYTFKGLKKIFRNLTTLKKYNKVFTKKQAKDKILTKIEDQVRLFDKHHLASFYNYIKASKTSNYKFLLSTIIYNNNLLFNYIVQNILLNSPKHFIIKWYNKIHLPTQLINKNNIVLFLRSHKHFNKGRYSRNRQLYRTGVYWCIWLNIIIVYSLHFYFYRVVYSFGYVWLPIGLLILSIFSSRLYKYRYYNIKNLSSEIKEFNNFLYIFFKKTYYVFTIFLKIKVAYFFNFWTNYIYILYNFIFSRIRATLIFLKKTIF